MRHIIEVDVDLYYTDNKFLEITVEVYLFGFLIKTAKRKYKNQNG